MRVAVTPATAAGTLNTPSESSKVTVSESSSKSEKLNGERSMFDSVSSLTLGEAVPVNEGAELVAAREIEAEPKARNNAAIDSKLHSAG